MKIYVASSSRNVFQPTVVNELRYAGHEVYDFHHPTSSTTGFVWPDVGRGWADRSEADFLKVFSHPIAREAYKRDMKALDASDAVILVLPSGRSSHLEAGYAKGRGKPLVLLACGVMEPELMYNMADILFFTITGVVDYLQSLEEEARTKRLLEQA